MAGGINISFLSDVRGFLRGTKDVETALEGVSDSLDDVARDAQKSGEKAGDGLSDGLRTGGKDAERALEDVQDTAKKSLSKVGDHADDAAKDTKKSAEKMERSFRDTFDTATKESKKAGDDIGTNTKKGFDTAGDSVGEFKDEANSTARETAASFDGSADSITGAFQEVAANAFGGFGPAGAAAGLAAAAGIGLITAEMERSKERTEELKQKVTDLATEIISAGEASAPLAENFSKQMQDWVLGSEVMGKTYEDAKTNLEGLGLTGADVDTILRGMVGGPEDMQAALAILRGEEQKVKEEFDDGNDLQKTGYFDRLKLITDVITQVGGEATAQETAQARAQEAMRQTSRVTQSEQRAIIGGYDNFPREINTKVTADASQAQRELDEFLRINASRKVNIATGMGGAGGITRASGGYIGGEGSDIEDRVRLNASPGEYVLDAQAVSQIGVGRLDQMNNGQMPSPPARAARPVVAVQIDVHPSAGLDEAQVGAMVGRQLEWLLRR